jgi:hypothetical protein
MAHFTKIQRALRALEDRDWDQNGILGCISAAEVQAEKNEECQLVSANVSP